MIRILLVTLVVCGLNLQGVASADTAPGSQSSDAALTARVVRQLAESDREIAPRVQVSAENGVVTLQANGLTSAQVAKLLVDARAIPGVTKVKNRLHIGM
jgi:osmotically-inducible protein OsmY